MARWDGYRAKVIKQGQPRAVSPASNFYLTLHCDSRGQLWAGTMFGGLLKYDAAKELFEPWQAADGKGLSGQTVYQVVDDGPEGLLVATDGGLDRLNLGSGAVDHASASGQWAEAAGPQIQSVLVDKRGRLWLGTARGLYMRSTPTSELQAVQLDERSDVIPRTLAQDQVGRIWVGTDRRGAFVLTVQEGHIDAARVATSSLPEGPRALESTAIVSMAEARPGEMWLATLDQGIVVVSLDLGWSRRINHVPDSASSLIDNSPHHLFRDRNGLMWVGSTFGVSRHDPQPSGITHRFGMGPDETRLYAPTARSEVSWIMPVPEGGYWLGTHKAGIERLDTTGRHLGQVLLDASRPATEPQDMVLGMARSNDGSVYIASNRGLFRARGDGRRSERVNVNGRSPSAATFAVLADGDDLWIGGREDGLWHLNLKNGGSGRALLQAPGLSNSSVTLLAGNRREGIWVGTRNGLNRIDVVSGRVTRILSDRIRNTFVSALLTDKRGKLWVGTFGGGIDILPLDGNESKVLHLGTEQGLPAASVNAMLNDDQGAVWVSMDGSLARIDPELLTVRPLERSDGVLLPAYWTGSAARGTTGDLLFGGAGGITVVHPERIQRSPHTAQVLVSEIRVGGKAVVPSAQRGRIQIPADGNELAIEISSSAFASPERNRFAFKLDGLDVDWRETDATRRSATYANIPPGDYTLHLRASNGDGVWTETEKTLAVRVLPAWYQTWWLRTGLALALMAAFAGAVGLRTRWLQARQRVLEQRVLERTAELKAAHEALEEKSRQLELSSLTDPLTGLHNRRYVSDHIERDLAAGRRRAIDARAAGSELIDTDTAFLLVDLDRFKQVNDVHGHAAGDAVLVELGQRLRKVLRESDYLVRWGGEEFLAVARDTDRLRVEELAERMRQAVANRPFALPDGKLLPVTCSIGFACMALAQEHASPEQWPEVVDRADKGLYAAKRAGRDAWVGIHRRSAESGATTVELIDGLYASSSRSLSAVAKAY